MTIYSNSREDIKGDINNILTDFINDPESQDEALVEYVLEQIKIARTEGYEKGYEDCREASER